MVITIYIVRTPGRFELRVRHGSSATFGSTMGAPSYARSIKALAHSVLGAVIEHNNGDEFMFSPDVPAELEAEQPGAFFPLTGDNYSAARQVFNACPNIQHIRC